MRKVYLSQSDNPYFNLAFEEYLVRHHSSEDQILFLWQNQNTVVIGRNQNPWKECNLEELNRQEGRLVRRLSGGGAVYHDLGNLNFTFISNFSEGKVEENIGSIIKALSFHGIQAVFSGKNDILVQGHKISGNAFFVEDDILCHHGTLLVDADLEKLSGILTVSQKKLQSKGIDSVKSRVVNIKALNHEISIESLETDLINVFLPEGEEASVLWVHEGEVEDGHINLETVHHLMKNYESWEWNFGASPEFNLQISERFSWGAVDLYLMVNDGIIVNMEVNTDALDVDIPQKLKERIYHNKFDYDEIISLLDTYPNA
ncbi:MAG TPA: lipoate--protein ligase [Anaerovoracaceae bacterium]|nr:lipoate--protein ligase [Anaerovoracaceae bacterium]